MHIIPRGAVPAMYIMLYTPVPQASKNPSCVSIQIMIL